METKNHFYKSEEKAKCGEVQHISVQT